MLESGFFLTVEFTAAKISQRFTSDPLSVMFLVMVSLIGGNIRQTWWSLAWDRDRGAWKRSTKKVSGFVRRLYLATLLSDPSSEPAILRNVSKLERISCCWASMSIPADNRFCWSKVFDQNSLFKSWLRNGAPEERHLLLACFLPQSVSAASPGAGFGNVWSQMAANYYQGAPTWVGFHLLLKPSPGDSATASWSLVALAQP